MPIVNKRYYMNPSYGQSLERARQKNQDILKPIIESLESGSIRPLLKIFEDNRPSQADDLIPQDNRQKPPQYELVSAQAQNADRPARAQQGGSEAGEPQESAADGHWVTIDHRRVFIDDAPRDSQRQVAPKTPHLSDRDKAYLDKYYDAVIPLAKKYSVDPALVLGLGIESDFASAGTYLRTDDAFGMTGGNTKHMTRASSPSENVKQFFDAYGEQIRGTGGNMSAFVNGLLGRDVLGDPVAGWKVYNSVNPQWERFVEGGIQQMKSDIPVYLAQKKKEHVR